MSSPLFTTIFLQEKIKEPLTDDVSKQNTQIWGLLVMLGSCFVDLSSQVDHIAGRIEGNGKIGLVGEMMDVRNQLSLIVPIMEKLKIRRTDDGSTDTFKSFLRWFVDKIIPTLLTSLITFLAVLLYLTQVHLSNP